MKKLLLILLCLPLVYSCGEKGKEKEKKKEKDEYNFRPLEIKEPCDCVDHMVELFNEALRILKSGNKNPWEDEALENHSEKIQEYCDDKFEWSDKERVNILTDCDGSEEIKKILKEMGELS